jgi:hypothetical protein
VRNGIKVWVIVPRRACTGLNRSILASTYTREGERLSPPLTRTVFATRREAEVELLCIKDGLRQELGIAYCNLELLGWPR